MKPRYLLALLSASITTVALAAPSTEERSIDQVGWSVTLTSAIYDAESMSTTLTYSVAASCEEKDLSHWVLAFDTDITPLQSVTPSSPVSYGLDPTTGVWGIKWDGGQLACTTETYEVVVPCDLTIGTVDYSVKGGTYYAIGQVDGPLSCGTNEEGTTYSISGYAYIDSLNNLMFDQGEPVLENVTIELLDANGDVVAVTLTDTSGGYTFGNVIAGDYQVNAYYQNSYVDPVTSTSVAVSVSNDVTDVNFGYLLALTDIYDDLDPNDPDGDGLMLSGEGKTIGFWKHQHSVAIKGRGRAQVDALTLQSYLTSIEGLWLTEPFQFVNDFEDALAVLSTRSSDATDLLNKQLLATELNHMANMGIDAALQALVLQHAEYLSYNNASFSRETLLAVKDILDAINNLNNN